MSDAAIRALVVDDEPLARRGLAGYLARESDLEVVGEAGDGVAAVRAIRELDPDLVFLDIQMPESGGFDVVEEIGPDAMPPVVFVTAYDDFALQAFDALAVDYVLKPLDPDRVARAVDRARRFIAGAAGESRGAGSEAAADRLARLLRHVEERRHHLRRFTVRDGGLVRFVDVRDVAWVEADGNYVVLHGPGGEHRVRATMAMLERRLDPSEFVRIHRSTFVRVDRIRALEPLHQGDYVIVLDDGTRLPSSRSCRDNVRGLLDGHA